MNRYAVRCIKMMSAEAITDAFLGVVAASWTAEEETDLLIASTMASAYGF